jgi:hypothetical protein
MADTPDESRRKIEKGRQDVADTSSAIAEKLAILEHRAQETVDAVKHGVDFHYQMKQRPWLMIGGSVVLGYALGRRRGRSLRTTDTPRVPSARTPSPQSVASQATSPVQDHLASFKGAALAAVTSTLWAVAKQVLLPTARRVGVIAEAGAQPVNSSKVNGATSGVSEPAPASAARTHFREAGETS